MEEMGAGGMRQPIDPVAPENKKNVSRDDIGDKIGGFHVAWQDLSIPALVCMKHLVRYKQLSTSMFCQHFPTSFNQMLTTWSTNKVEATLLPYLCLLSIQLVVLWGNEIGFRKKGASE